MSASTNLEAKLRVSVVLPTYNRLRTLPRAIQSVLAQTYADLELIVVDDGSSDGTEAFVRGLQDPRLVYLRREQPSGVSAARNFGIAAARGELLAFQDSDDEWLLHKLKAQVDLLDKLGDEFALVGSTVMRYTGGPVTTVSWPLAGEGPEVDPQRLIGDFIAYIQSALVRRRCIEHAGGFDAAMKVCEDWELCLRLVKNRYRLATVPELLVITYETAGSLAAQQDLRQISLRHAMDRHPDLLTVDDGVHSNLLYHVAKAYFYAGDAGAGRRLAWQSAMRRPAHVRPWLLLAASMLGLRGLQGMIASFRGVKRRFGVHH